LEEWFLNLKSGISDTAAKVTWSDEPVPSSIDGTPALPSP
jgi:hypothetical protein